jgi:hypothetical protein
MATPPRSPRVLVGEVDLGFVAARRTSAADDVDVLAIFDELHGLEVFARSWIVPSVEQRRNAHVQRLGLVSVRTSRGAEALYDGHKPRRLHEQGTSSQTSCTATSTERGGAGTPQSASRPRETRM